MLWNSEAGKYRYEKNGIQKLIKEKNRVLIEDCNEFKGKINEVESGVA